MRLVWLTATVVLTSAVIESAAIPVAQADDLPVLRISQADDPDALDPTLGRSYAGRVVFAALCDKLFDIDAKLDIVPQLALGYAWLDATTLRIDLRHDVMFQDGTKLDAQAVQYSLQRHLIMAGSARRGELATVERIEVLDPFTLKLVLKVPTAPLLTTLTDRAGMIVSPKAAEAEGRDFALHPVCAGPFKFTERVAQDHITLDRFEGYWDAKNIHLGRVVFRTIIDNTATVANLRAGSIDIAGAIVPSNVKAVAADPKTRIITSPALGYLRIEINVGHGPRGQGPMADVRVRKAFEAAIDRAAINDVVYNGMYTPNAQAIPPSSPFYDAALKPPGRDLALARRLLVEAGVKLPVAISMNVPNSPTSLQTAEVIQSMVAEAGFDLKINAMEFATSLSAQAQGDFETYLITWSGRSDPDGNLWTFLHSGPQGAGAATGYANPQMDHLLDAAREAIDVKARAELYHQVVELAERDLPIMTVYTPVNIVGVSARLSGFKPVPDGIIRPQGLMLGK